MVIDTILDRKDGAPYTPKAFYDAMAGYGEIAEDIVRAMENGTERDVARALNVYVVANDYNPEICQYINSVNWLAGEDPNK